MSSPAADGAGLHIWKPKFCSWSHSRGTCFLPHVVLSAAHLVCSTMVHIGTKVSLTCYSEEDLSAHMASLWSIPQSRAPGVRNTPESRDFY